MIERISFVDTHGNETLLTDPPNIKYLYGRTGAFITEFDTIEEKTPGRPGVKLQVMTIEPVEVELPFRVRGSNAADLWGRLRRMRQAFNPMLGDGYLRVTSPDGVQREMKGRFIDFIVKEDSKSSFYNDNIPSFQDILLVFKGFEGVWESTSTITKTFTTGSVVNFFPILPLRLASSTVFSSDNVTNNGDLEAYPVFTITGPGNNIALNNLTTSKTISFSDLTLSVGETLTIDTKAGTIVKNGYIEAYSSLDWGCSLWPLVPGENKISIEMSGGTENSSVVISYKERFIGL
jgi:phage-related protein